MPQVAMVIGAVASVYGTVKANQAAQKAAKKQEQQQAAATRRSRRQAVRQMQLQRAQAIAGAGGAGSLGGSGSLGGIGSLGSQLGESMGFSTMMSGLSRQINQAQRDQMKYEGYAQLGQLAFNYGASAQAQAAGTGG